jgi:transcriptional regulator with XRE-family HTH domain
MFYVFIKHGLEVIMAEKAQESVDLKLGMRIRSLREQKGLKIVDVANLTGLTLSMISRVERGAVSPSVDTLTKIGNALNTPVGFLFLEDELANGRIAQPNPVVHEHTRKILSPQRGIIFELLNPNLEGPIEFLYVVYEPGAYTGHDNYTHKGSECGLILQGELLVVSGDKEYLLHEGDSITLCSETPHMKKNISDVPCISIWANTPPFF